MSFCGNCGTAIKAGTICVACTSARVQLPTERRSVAVRRFSAGVVDLLFATGVAVGIGAWMVAFKKIIPIPGVRKILGLTLPIIFWVMYLLIKDGFGGKSLGKVLCNVSVINKHGRPAGFIDSINRNWPLWIPPLTLLVGLQLMMGRQTRLGETLGTAVTHDDDLLGNG